MNKEFRDFYEIYPVVTETMEHVLSVDPDELHPGTNYYKDLDVESIDDLCVNFRLEQQFGTIIRRDEFMEGMGTRSPFIRIVMVLNHALGKNLPVEKTAHDMSTRYAQFIEPNGMRMIPERIRSDYQLNDDEYQTLCNLWKMGPLKTDKPLENPVEYWRLEPGTLRRFTEFLRYKLANTMDENRQSGES